LLLLLSFLPCTLASPGESDKAAVTAVESGDFQELTRLLAAGADANTRDEHGHPILMLAAAAGNKQIVQLLIVHGSDVKAQYRPGQAPFGQTPLHIAAGYGRRDVVELLIAHDADVNAKDTKDITPLLDVVYGSISPDSPCARKMNLQMLWTLLRLTRVASATERRETATLLLDHGASLANGGRQPPILFAAAMCGGDPGMVELLIDRGANMDEVNPLVGETALHAAIAERRKDMATLLINRGANVNARNLPSSRTPLHFLASLIDDPDLAELMIKHGADVNARDKNGATPLAFTVGRRNVRVAEVLRLHGGI
jgi:ankyrin repeat protein